MSFDIYLEGFKSGAPVEVPKSGILSILKSKHFTGPDGFGFYNVQFPDGETVEFSAAGLEADDPFRGCAFHVRGFSKHLVEFIFEVARVGDMTIIPVIEESIMVLPSDDAKKELPPEVLLDFRLVPLTSVAELEVVLQQGFSGWSKYREQVAPSSADPKESD